MSIAASFQADLPPHWLTVEPVHLGGTHASDVAPDRYLIVEGEGVRLRCDLYPNGSECHPFQDAQIWRGLLLVGYGCCLYVVNLATRTVVTHRFGSYFGELTVAPDYCLVASGCGLYRVGDAGQFLWSNRDLAWDGIVVGGIEGDVIEGRAEMDPPGDWRPFEVRLSDGTTITSPND